MYELMDIANVRARFPIAKKCALLEADDFINDYTRRLQNGEIDFIKPPNPIGDWQSIKQAIINL